MAALRSLSVIGFRSNIGGLYGMSKSVICVSVDIWLWTLSPTLQRCSFNRSLIFVFLLCGQSLLILCHSCFGLFLCNLKLSSAYSLLSFVFRFAQAFSHSVLSGKWCSQGQRQCCLLRYSFLSSMLSISLETQGCCSILTLFYKWHVLINYAHEKKTGDVHCLIDIFCHVNLRPISTCYVSSHCIVIYMSVAVYKYRFLFFAHFILFTTYESKHMVT